MKCTEIKKKIQKMKIASVEEENQLFDTLKQKYPVNLVEVIEMMWKENYQLP